MENFLKEIWKARPTLTQPEANAKKLKDIEARAGAIRVAESSADAALMRTFASGINRGVEIATSRHHQMALQTLLEHQNTVRKELGLEEKLGVKTKVGPYEVAPQG